MIAVMETYYGKKMESYNLVLSSMFHPGGYGPGIERKGGTAVYSVQGPVNEEDGLPVFGSTESLLVWFTLAVTGFSFGNFILIERDFDLTVCIMWILYAISVILFFWKEKIGKYITGILLFLWITIQCLDLTTRTQEGIAGYNRVFEKAHHIITPSNAFPIPDTYHLVLLFFIALSLVNVIVFIAKTRHRKSQ